VTPSRVFLSQAASKPEVSSFLEVLENRVFSSQGASKPEVSSFLEVLESRKSEVSSFLEVPSFLEPRGLEARSVEFSRRS
jgi:hypothetical protein